MKINKMKTCLPFSIQCVRVSYEYVEIQIEEVERQKTTLKVEKEERKKHF